MATEKAWGKDGPFARVRSPSARQRPPLNGIGHALGCRREVDFPASFLLDFLMRKTVLLAPSWVKTLTTGNDDAAEHSDEQELFGVLARSFQTWTDAPGAQWHLWYDWNLHVQPRSEFDWLRGEGNRDKLPPHAGAEQLIQDAMECEWDTGAFGTAPGPMFNQSTSNIDWAWPMTGDDVWVVGRSIYDGGHENNGKTRSELHPCKAIASVRREAFSFPENGFFTPAVQFAFFTSRLGGYVDFDALGPPPGQDDYEFLVDLPLQPDELKGGQAPLGATPDFPLNRLVLRRLESLVNFDFTTHQSAAGKKLTPVELLADFKPVVTPVTPDPGKPLEQQVRIVIPLKSLRDKHPDTDSYGVIISFGWEDPSKTQGKRVKKCTVQFQEAHAASLGASFNLPPLFTDSHSDFFTPDEWRFKTCVNNRWFQWEGDGIVGEKNIFSGNLFTSRLALPHPPIVFHLEESDTIRVHAHGASLNIMDDFIKKDVGDRTVTFQEADVQDEAALLKEPSGRPPASRAVALPPAVAGALATTPNVSTNPAAAALVQQVVPGAPTDLLAETVALWKRDLDPQPPKPNGTWAIQRVLARNIFSKFAGTLKDENDPLGMCDPGKGFPSENALNPLPLNHPSLAGGQVLPIKLKGLLLGEDEKLAELFEPARGPEPLYELGGPKRGDVNYVLSYTVKVEPQFA